MGLSVHLDTRGLDRLIKQGGENPSYIIHDGVEYGVYQEFTDSGHPSLRPAFETHAQQMLRAVGPAIERGVPLDSVVGKAAADIQRDWAGDVNIDTGAYKNSITHEKER